MCVHIGVLTTCLALASLVSNQVVGMCVFERERARIHTCMQRESAYRARERGTIVLHASKEQAKSSRKRATPHLHQKESDTALAPVIIRFQNF